MGDVQVRGCCCGIPFGCGTLALAGAGIALWKLASPEWLGLLAGLLSALG